MASLQQVFNWFKTGMYPTESQFKETFSSFWHKSEQIPGSSIEGGLKQVDQASILSPVDGILTIATSPNVELFSRVRLKTPITLALPSDNRIGSHYLLLTNATGEQLTVSIPSAEHIVCLYESVTLPAGQSIEVVVKGYEGKKTVCVFFFYDSQEITPDPFVKGVRSEIVYNITTLQNYYSEYINATDWTSQAMQNPSDLGRVLGGTVERIPTQEIGEYVWMAKSPALDYGANQTSDPTYYGWLALTQEQVNDSENFGLPISRYDFLTKINGYGCYQNLASPFSSPYGQFSKCCRHYKKVDVQEVAKTIGTCINTGTTQHANDPLLFTLPNLVNLLNSSSVITSITMWVMRAGVIKITAGSFTAEKEAISTGRFTMDVEIPYKGIANLTITSNNARLANNGNVDNKVYGGLWYANGYAQVASPNIEIVSVEKNVLTEIDKPYRWRLPNIDDYLQLVGQAPTTHTSAIDRAIHFLGANAQTNGLAGVDVSRYAKGNDTSGFGLFLTGSRQHVKEYPNYYSLGKSAPLMLNNTTQYNGVAYPVRMVFQNQTETDMSKGIAVNRYYHMAQFRNCYHKTDAELGYAYYIDEATDTVQMLDYNASSEFEVQELVHIWLKAKFDVNGAKKLDIYAGLDENNAVVFYDADNKEISKPTLNGKKYKGGTELSDTIQGVNEQIEVPANASYVIVNIVLLSAFEVNVEFDNMPALPRLRKGLARGIALRYTNREHRKVLRKWSEIKQEAEGIMKEIG